MKNFRKMVTGLLLGAGLLTSFAVSAADLEVEVIRLRNDQGNVRVALYNGAEGYLDDSACFRGVTVETSNQRAKTVFTNLPEGKYALAVFHDENLNGEMDTNWLGTPQEGIGFSNSARISFGPPSFDEAAITVGDAKRIETISIEYR